MYPAIDEQLSGPFSSLLLILGGRALSGGLASLFEWSGLKQPIYLDFQQFLDSLSISPLVPPEVLEVARKAHGLPYPPHWSEELDAASGALYFYHELRDESSWQHPLTDTFREVLHQVTSFAGERLRLDQLAGRIEESLTEIQARAAADLQQWTGPLGDTEQYYYNNATGCSTWEDPCERWRYDIHVRYDLLVGFLVAEERRARSCTREAMPDLTHTLTSLASSVSSVQSILASSLTAPVGADPDDPEAGTRWARPRPRRSCLPLPPKATGASAPRRALFSMPPHQQQYATQVLQTDAPTSAGFAAGFAAAAKNGAPPPPPSDSPTRWAVG
ncbi:unnamed protein product [Durusdinium trenchii]|uniref:WW domain-containing protein n=1 Tax=Durusdinium trenchii TaxID=1381693 RepID=A0ABP0S8V5_9DINO